jgi:hypothetical protein
MGRRTRFLQGLNCLPVKNAAAFGGAVAIAVAAAAPPRLSAAAPDRPAASAAEAKPAPAKPKALRPAKRGTINVPSADATAKRIELVRDVYRDDIRNAKTPEATKKLSDKLMAFGRDDKTEASERYAAIVLARDLAVEGSLVTDAIAATSLLGSVYDTDDIKEFNQVVDRLAKTARTAEAQTQLVEAAIQLADESRAAKRTKEAKQFLTTAEATAKAANNSKLIQQVRDAMSRLTAR